MNGLSFIPIKEEFLLIIVYLSATVQRYEYIFHSVINTLTKLNFVSVFDFLMTKIGFKGLDPTL